MRIIDITISIRMFMSNDEEEIPWSESENEIPWANPTKNAVSSVQVQGNSMVGQYTETNAVMAMILAAVSYFMCGICSAIPAVIIANGALQITSNQPGTSRSWFGKSCSNYGLGNDCINHNWNNSLGLFLCINRRSWIISRCLIII